MKNNYKRAWKIRKAHKDAKAIGGFIILIIMIVTATKVFTPIVGANAETRTVYLPHLENKKELTGIDNILIASSIACNKHKLDYGCIEDLIAIAHNEKADFDCDANGDFGASHGCFQIHLGYHQEVTQEQARDANFAAQWTLDRMVKFGYPEYRSSAIRRHNGSATNPKTLVYLNKVNSYINE